MRSTVLSVCVVVLVGCGQTGPAKPKLAKVTGTVTYNNAPLVGANVRFSGVDGSLPAVGVTDSAGKYELGTYGTNDGAVLGEHQVTITMPVVAPTQLPPADATKGLNTPSPEAMAKMAEQLATQKAEKKLPAKYQDPKQSGLRAVVVEGDNNFEYALKD